MKNIILIFTLLLVSTSCSQKNECQEEQLTVHHFNCDYAKYSLHIDITNKYTIIRSKETYDSIVTGDCHPTIDFSIYDLVIGKQSSGNENDTIKYDLRRTCPGNDLILNVDIIQSLMTRPDNVIYHALIPKQDDKEAIRIKINVQ